MNTLHSYGWRRDAYDWRDESFALHYPRFRVLPKKTDLRGSQFPAVGNQTTLGSCTGWGIANGMLEQLNLKYDSLPDVDLSPLFLYQQELILEKAFGRDQGARIRDGFKVAAKIGCATEADWPYDISKFNTMPPQPVVDSAAKFKIRSYHRLSNLNDMKNCLAEGFGFVYGFIVRDSFERISSNGVMSMPKFWERILGGHCVFGCGYEDDESFISGRFYRGRLWPGGGYITFLNSWSTAWGDQGFGYMPYAYMKFPSVSDSWTAR
ncbi:MAG: C1 family peptidase [Methanothrix sp.]|nr:C1 family peptidase [Methanothrix sp.]